MLYEFSYEHKCWVKQCSICKHVYQGTDDEEKSLEKFQSLFSSSGRKADGLDQRCKSCDSNRRNGRRGNINKFMLVEAQQYKCKICAAVLRAYNYHVDHDHKTGLTRGALCVRCNLWMAAVDDDAWLAKAIKYRDSFR